MPRLFQQFEEQLDIYLRARFTLLVLVTPEEERALQKIRAVCERTQRHCLAWDLADGFQWVVGSGALPVARDPLTALEQIDHAEAAVSTLYILKDFHEAWGNPQIKRKLRNLAQRLKFTKKSILITTVTSHIPNELRDEAVLVDFALPLAEELEE
ncbi:MAG: AAA family ATPase, partial [Thermanaerothrix sp.]